ncbi:MAG TPA: HK97 family phage prohead protease [Syntrophales bacterium]|jgi:HK97 family phage prohead protease|nr:HK97 family phage prohead protease [Syntrophales bacterium]
MKQERRTLHSEFRVEQREDGKKLIRGHAAVFNSETDLGWFRERIAPGAFSESIGKDDVRALFNHDENFILGRNKAGTLTMREDEQGLYVEIDPPDTQVARDLVTSIERGDISQMSFGFQTIKDSWETEENAAKDLRTLEKVKLWDVSPVTFPAYQETDVAVRSHDCWSQSKAESLKYKPFKTALLRRRLALTVGGSSR